MEIKPITADDLPDLILLQKELLDEAGDLDRMRELLPAIQNDRNYYLLGVRSKGRLVASLAGIVCHDLFGKCIPFMLVENVIVSSAARHQGIGTRLMLEIERIAKARGCRYLMLVSSAKRNRAHDFYHRLGFDSDDYRGFKKILEADCQS